MIVSKPSLALKAGCWLVTPSLNDSTFYRAWVVSCRATAQPAAKRGEAGTQKTAQLVRNAGTPRKVSTPVANSNAWSQDPWRAQQQWGWQWGSGQQRGEERREWRTPQPTWGSRR